jgi:hypothetical protein
LVPEERGCQLLCAGTCPAIPSYHGECGDSFSIKASRILIRTRRSCKIKRSLDKACRCPNVPSGYLLAGTKIRGAPRIPKTAIVFHVRPEIIPDWSAPSRGSSVIPVNGCHIYAVLCHMHARDPCLLGIGVVIKWSMRSRRDQRSIAEGTDLSCSLCSGMHADMTQTWDKVSAACMCMRVNHLVGVIQSLTYSLDNTLRPENCREWPRNNCGRAAFVTGYPILFRLHFRTDES